MKDHVIKALLIFSMAFIPSLVGYRLLIAPNECEKTVEGFYMLQQTRPPLETVKQAEGHMNAVCAAEGKQARPYLRLFEDMNKPRDKG